MYIKITYTPYRPVAQFMATVFPAAPLS